MLHVTKQSLIRKKVRSLEGTFLKPEPRFKSHIFTWCPEFNANEESQFFSLICSKFGTFEPSLTF